MEKKLNINKKARAYVVRKYGEGAFSSKDFVDIWNKLSTGYISPSQMFMSESLFNEILDLQEEDENV